MVEITQEQSNVVAPSGRMLLAVKFPPQSFVHIKHLLLSFPTTPGKIGLLVGVLHQTQLLNAQASALNTASGKGNTALVHCLAQSVMDISEGSTGEHYKPLSAECRELGVTQAGDGFGLLSPVQAAAPGSNWPVTATAVTTTASRGRLATSRTPPIMRRWQQPHPTRPKHSASMRAPYRSRWRMSRNP